MDVPIIAYIALILTYRLAEYWARSQTGSMERPSRPEPSALLIAIPYYIILVGPMIEHFWFESSPDLVFMIAGGIFFIGATIIRTKAHFDLGKAFSMYLDTGSESGIVRSGLYAHIRHPLYLANILLFIACPLFLQSRFTWAVTLLGVLGVLLRIYLEEQYLRERVAGYDEYETETWALVPGLY